MPDFDVDPQGFWWNPDIDLATLKKDIRDNSGRLVSLDAFVAGGKLRFCAAWIANAGAAKATWNWDHDITPEALGKKMGDLPGRITCLSSYVLNGKRRYAAVWVKNTGSQKKAWWWHPDLDAESLGKDLQANKGRLISVDVWMKNGKPRCAAVWIANAGADAAPSWWHPGVDADTLAGFLADNNGRIVCLDAYKVGNEVRYAAAWIENSGVHGRTWFWWHGLDEKGLGQKFDLFCCYTAEVRSYPVSGGKRHLVGVLYAGPQAADPDGAPLLQASGSAQLNKVSEDSSDTDDPAPLHQWMDVQFQLKNASGGPVKITLAELYAAESGGFIYPDTVENALTGLFSGGDSTLAAGDALAGSGTREWGFGISHYLLRWHAQSGSKRQRGFATVPVLRSGYAHPPVISASTPVYLALWTQPAELVPIWDVGKKKTWLSLGGQIVNISGKKLRIAGFQVILTVDGKTLVDQPVLPAMQHFVPNATDPDKELKAVGAPKDGIQELTSFVTYFVEGIAVPKVPKSFAKASLRLILNYKIEDRCGAAVLDAPVIRVKPVVVEPPLEGKWNFGSSPDHRGFDAHTWPAQRFSIDFTKLGSDGNSFKKKSDLKVNTSFWAYHKTIRAIASGIVVEAVDTNPENHGRKMLADPKVNYILILNNPGKPGSFYHGYYHVSTGKNKVAAGDSVQAGDEIGQVGNAGGSSEPHLHLGVIRLDATGRGTMAPMAFKQLKSGNQTVTDVPATGEYTH